MQVLDKIKKIYLFELDFCIHTVEPFNVDAESIEFCNEVKVVDLFDINLDHLSDVINSILQFIHKSNKPIVIIRNIDVLDMRKRYCDVEGIRTIIDVNKDKSLAVITYQYHENMIREYLNKKLPFYHFGTIFSAI